MVGLALVGHGTETQLRACVSPQGEGFSSSHGRYSSCFKVVRLKTGSERAERGSGQTGFTEQKEKGARPWGRSCIEGGFVCFFSFLELERFANVYWPREWSQEGEKLEHQARGNDRRQQVGQRGGVVQFEAFLAASSIP